MARHKYTPIYQFMDLGINGLQKVIHMNSNQILAKASSLAMGRRRTPPPDGYKVTHKILLLKAAIPMLAEQLGLICIGQIKKSMATKMIDKMDILSNREYDTLVLSRLKALQRGPNTLD